MSVDVLKFAQDNMLLLGVAIASGGLLIWPSLRGGGSGQTISSAEAVGRSEEHTSELQSH